MRVLRRPLLTVAVLFGLDYLLWLWSLGGSRGAVGMFAGPLLVLLATAFLLLAIKQAARTLARARRRPQAAKQAGSPSGAPSTMRYGESAVAMSAHPEGGAAPGYGDNAPVVSGPSSAQIAA